MGGPYHIHPSLYLVVFCLPLRRVWVDIISTLLSWLGSTLYRPFAGHSGRYHIDPSLYLVYIFSIFEKWLGGRYHIGPSLLNWGRYQYIDLLEFICLNILSTLQRWLGSISYPPWLLNWLGSILYWPLRGHWGYLDNIISTPLLQLIN